MFQILRRARFTATLLALIAVAFLVETALGGSTRQGVLLFLGANRWPLEGEYWRLLASMFLHIGLFHVLVNGWALYQLGALFEIWVGWKRMAAVYFASGILGSAASLWFTLRPAEGPTLSAGASGAIFGILGALIGFLFRRRDRLTPQAKGLLFQLLFWAALNVFLGFTAAGIDNSAHMGGFATGLVFGAFLQSRHEMRRQRTEPEVLPPEGPGAFSEKAQRDAARGGVQAPPGRHGAGPSAREESRPVPDR